MLNQTRNTLHTRSSVAEFDEAPAFGVPPGPASAPSSYGSGDMAFAVAADRGTTDVRVVPSEPNRITASTAGPDTPTAPRRAHAAMRLELRDKPKAVAGSVVALLAVGGFLFAMSLFGGDLSRSSGEAQGPGTAPINLPTGFTSPPLTPSATAGSPGEPAGASGGSPTATEAVLRKGDSGPRVRELQALLHQIPGLYGAGAGETDGRYDVGVAQSVARFQKEAGISSEPAGVYGPVTQYALETRVQQQTVNPVEGRNDDVGEGHE